MVVLLYTGEIRRQMADWPRDKTGHVTMWDGSLFFVKQAWTKWGNARQTHIE